MSKDINDVKIKRRFMRDEAYDILQDWIMVGKLEPHTKLRDQELSEMLGISRTPIREALLRLEDEGFVVTKPNRWTLVAPMDVEEAENIYSIVWTMECLALEQAIDQITVDDIQELNHLNEMFKQTTEQEDQLASLQADNEFHNYMINRANNPELAKILQNLKVKIQRIEIHYFRYAAKDESYLEHGQILEALKNKDLNKAKQLIQANWQNSLK
ncbi:MAG TPA: GntR family transcriptional regulator, partial [Bacillales bacterium]